MFWCLGLPLTAGEDQLTFQSDIPLAGISGASAIEVDEGGQSAIILSDRGSIFQVTFEREDGALKAVHPRLLTRKFENLDLEGLAIGPEGAFASFEGPSLVRRISTGQKLPLHPDFGRFEHNKGLEALAIDPEGRLVAMSEKPPKGRARAPIYRFDRNAWSVIGSLPDPMDYLPVAVDFGPDGQFYLLERTLSPLGFRSRLSRVDLTAKSLSREVLLVTGRGQHDNLEGLSVWRSKSGATCVTMVSDDNFSILQRSEVVEYALTETLALQQSCD